MATITPDGRVIPDLTSQQLTTLTALARQANPGAVSGITGGRSSLSVGQSGQSDIAPGDLATIIGLAQQRNPELAGRLLGGQFVPTEQQPAATPTGLIGSEQALQAGLSGGARALLTGAEFGRGDIRSGLSEALSQLQAGGADVGRQVTSALAQLAGAGRQAGGALSGAVSGLTGARGDIGRQIGQGVSTLSPFVEPGQMAQRLQAALSGALGPQEQARAFAEFQESPEQQFLREQGELSVLRQASALGGLGGGNVLRELTRFGTGLAAQDIQNRFGRLGAVTAAGLQAGGEIGRLRGQQAGITSSLAQAASNLRAQQADISSRLAQAGANLRAQQAGITSALSRAGADLSTAAGQNLANIAGTTGTNVANLLRGISGDVAAGRTRAGELIAQSIGETTPAVSSLIAQQGAGISDLIGSGAGRISGLLTEGAAQQSAADQQLAQILANLAVQQGSQVTGLPSLGQFAPEANQLGQTSQLLGSIGALLSV